MKHAFSLRKGAFILLLAGASTLAFTACGSNHKSDAQMTDSLNNADKNGIAVDTTRMGRDTAPGAEMPPGAINPGEDSSRYGTGTQDSSKNRTGVK